MAYNRWDKISCPTELMDRIDGLMKDLGLNYHTQARWGSLLLALERLMRLPKQADGGCSCERCCEFFTDPAWADEGDYWVQIEGDPVEPPT